MIRQYLFREKDKLVWARYRERTLIDLRVFEEEDWKDREGREARVGEIHAGRIAKCVESIHACFVDIGEETEAFLPMDRLTRPSILLLKGNPDSPYKAGNEILVEVKKEAYTVKGVRKGATLSSEIHIPSSTVILFPSERQREIRFSSKLQNEEKKEWLRREFSPLTEHSILFRTEAGSASEEEIRRDLLEQDAILRGILKEAPFVRPPHKMYTPDSSFLRDILGREENRKEPILVEDSELFSFLKKEGEKRGWVISAELYQDPLTSLPNLLRWESEKAKLLSRKVYLPSGADLSIDPTEALTVIDVNTAKSAPKKLSKEQHIHSVNMEAGREILRQLRLRNISGIILVDFVDIPKGAEKEELLSMLREEALKDPQKCRIVDVTALGLVEITRQRKSATLREALNFRENSMKEMEQEC